jgi:MraZ protein
VAIPAEFREAIGKEKVVIMESFDGCLQAFPESEWEKLAEKKLAGLDFIESAEDLAIERKFFGSMAKCEMDKQGRVCLKPNHIKVAGIGKEVIFVGVRNRFEIWDLKRWNAYRAETKKREQARQS